MKKQRPYIKFIVSIILIATTGFAVAPIVNHDIPPEENKTINDVKETLIYENSFDKNQEEWMAEMKEEWVMEGKGIAESGDGYLSLRSEIFTVPRDKDGHFNFWLNRDFPQTWPLSGGFVMLSLAIRDWHLLSGLPKDEMVRIYSIPAFHHEEVK